MQRSNHYWNILLSTCVIYFNKIFLNMIYSLHHICRLLYFLDTTLCKTSFMHHWGIKTIIWINIVFARVEMGDIRDKSWCFSLKPSTERDINWLRVSKQSPSIEYPYLARLVKLILWRIFRTLLVSIFRDLPICKNSSFANIVCQLIQRQFSS